MRATTLRLRLSDHSLFSSSVKPYNHLPTYLHRWQVFQLGRLKVRVHDILTADETPFLHTHPFNYVSVVLSGGYTEQLLCDGNLVERSYKTGSVITHTNKTYHRISAVLPNTKTLFFAWDTTNGEQGWSLIRHPNIETPPQYIDVPDGVFWVGKGFRKRANGMWYALRNTAESAKQCDRLSIHQCISTEEYRFLLSTQQVVQ